MTATVKPPTWEYLWPIFAGYDDMHPPPPADKDEYKAWYHGVYRKTPWWLGMRQAAFVRANGRCEGCGVSLFSLPYWSLHHDEYTQPYRETPDCVRAVCMACHDKEHPKKSKGESLTQGTMHMYGPEAKNGTTTKPADDIWIRPFRSAEDVAALVGAVQGVLCKYRLEGNSIQRFAVGHFSGSQTVKHLRDASRARLEFCREKLRQDADAWLAPMRGMTTDQVRHHVQNCYRQSIVEALDLEQEEGAKVNLAPEQKSPAPRWVLPLAVVGCAGVWVVSILLLLNLLR